ncbi:MAG: UDP-N-acetylmuramoyl-L-alanine--D-glutamate ligase [Candidatus Latescibacteria bacterium]|nr:UDP-N-acetylmuramoyl-L-alanine--D-glutamate ligase [Candidatus Latescibacterota bacterium]
MRLAELTGKRMALLGLGVENQALGEYLLSKGLRFAVCDRQPEVAVRREWGDRVEQWRLGPDYLAGLADFEVIWRTPGISPLRPELRAAQAAGARLESQTRLFVERCPCPLIGVTATKGKGTTSSMLTRILQESRASGLYLGGNIGLPPISFLDALQPTDLVVLELSSFQLQDLEQSPQIAVVVNITQDHLDYHATREEYVEAKRNICRHQGPGEVLVVNQDCPTASGFAHEHPGTVWTFSTIGPVAQGAWVEAGQLWLRRPGAEGEVVCRVEEIPLRGRHNRENAAAAATAAAAAGASPAQIRAGILGFAGLPHRLERVGEYGGVLYYNDSLATTPDAAVAALQAFEEPVVLIAGGSSKGADFSSLGAQLAAGRVKAVVLLGEEGERIAQAAVQAGYAGELVRGCASMAEAVAQARLRVEPGEVVLLSPACASFGMFANYKDRGEQFKRAACGGG